MLLESTPWTGKVLGLEQDHICKVANRTHGFIQIFPDFLDLPKTPSARCVQRAEQGRARSGFLKCS